MDGHRICSRPACREAARATLTFVYADSTAVLGPLAKYPEPHCYDLCARHANRLTVPSGWNLIRGSIPQIVEPLDELNALVDAVRDRRPAERTPRHASDAPTDAPPARESRGPRLDSRVRLAVLPNSREDR